MSDLFENARKAYRLLYEIQDSIISFVEYFREKMDCNEWAGKQMFSSPISHKRPAVDEYASDYFGSWMWSWDYFPSYIYMYYFALNKQTTTGELNNCLAIIPVMDSGCENSVGKDEVPNTQVFKSTGESESYCLLAYALYKDDQSIWLDNGGVSDLQGIVNIAKEIRANNGKPHVITKDGMYLYVEKVGMNVIIDKDKADEVISNFTEHVKEQTGYKIIKEYN